MAGRPASPTSTSSTLSCITVATAQESPDPMSASPPGSTPPTSLGDEASIASDATIKMDQLVEGPESPEESTPIKQQPEDIPMPGVAPEETPQSVGRRSSRRQSGKVATYNVQILAGTAIHTPTKYLQKHHGNVYRGGSQGAVAAAAGANNTEVQEERSAEPQGTRESIDPVEQQIANEIAQDAHRRKSSRVDLRKEAIKNKMAATGSALAKRGQEMFSNGKDRIQQALGGSSQDSEKNSTKAIAKSSTKRSRPSTATEPEDLEEQPQQEQEFAKPKRKKWEEQGLYVGQHRGFDPRLTEGQNRQKRRLQPKENKALPLPLFNGERLLSGNPQENHRDFKLPFDVFSPLPRKIKVDGWVKLSKNRFVGDASSVWKKSNHQDGSKCYCSPEDGCGVSCHNRSMYYECNDSNCNLTPEECGNRPFAELKKRAKGNRYDYGVEVVETKDRGFGVRAMRSFDPYQIIVEYAGEIITQGECERRMKNEYKKNKCYYLMSFDNKTIIDATRGTIARFVNHSCEPNCEMIKWTVGTEPRMALFAGARGIMTGEELTYDYNFDPFSSKNIQICKCGTASCRGVLGPKPKDQGKDRKNAATSFITGTKRKIQEVLGSRGSGSAPSSPNKRQKTTSFASVALTKVQNALAETAASRAKAEKDAIEAAAQKMSREERANRRHSTHSAPVTLTSQTTSKVVTNEISRSITHGSNKVITKVSRASFPATTKRTTVSFLHKEPKPGQLRPVNKVGGMSSALQRHASALKDKSRLLSRSKTKSKIASKPPSKTPSKEAGAPSKSRSKVTASLVKPAPSQDILITASSLRSSLSAKFRQSTLTFDPMPAESSATPVVNKPINTDKIEEKDDDDDDDDDDDIVEEADPEELEKEMETILLEDEEEDEIDVDVDDEGKDIDEDTAEDEDEEDRSSSEEEFEPTRYIKKITAKQVQAAADGVVKETIAGSVRAQRRAAAVVARTSLGSLVEEGIGGDE
ncbi:hypothetical protein GQ43DRAFT_467746 [Delitschia confertaspora ATCC 74209]|uniref:SET domain-containing protein n=1 Tax=Delitschia confertaspora ATCC 74209 TaxID=1513339 RepID=A0A9P4JUN2_9PLEO|nr:hypothetical protein GQ43DRAFT_467746 [Delitschia confertaspora ATCC 74209]